MPNPFHQVFGGLVGDLQEFRRKPAMLADYLPWAALLGSEIGAQFESEAPDLVVGPAMGGIIIGHEVARYLGVPSPEDRKFKRHFSAGPSGAQPLKTPLGHPDAPRGCYPWLAAIAAAPARSGGRSR